jgi:hypothetical protein
MFSLDDVCLLSYVIIKKQASDILRRIIQQHFVFNENYHVSLILWLNEAQHKRNFLVKPINSVMDFMNLHSKFVELEGTKRKLDCRPASVFMVKHACTSSISHKFHKLDILWEHFSVALETFFMIVCRGSMHVAICGSNAG